MNDRRNSRRQRRHWWSRRQPSRIEVIGEVVESGAELAATGLIGLALRGGGTLVRTIAKAGDLFN